ncbi:MAG: thioesterase [Chloracidobacterium sp.]|nr:thioesterase [Chloracidobacterium sp.]MDW8216719.1 hotdog domain-containing protein [Acidobacteriota bacterium]
MNLSVGQMETVTYVVTKDDTAHGLSSHWKDARYADAYLDVFATIRMIALMELACGRLLEAVQQPDELSVGVEVNVRHLAPTPVGVVVTATATYLGYDGKLHRFRVEAFDPGGKIGDGEHARAIVQAERLLGRRAETLDATVTGYGPCTVESRTSHRLSHVGFAAAQHSHAGYDA